MVLWRVRIDKLSALEVAWKRAVDRDNCCLNDERGRTISQGIYTFLCLSLLSAGTRAGLQWAFYHALNCVMTILGDESGGMHCIRSPQFCSPQGRSQL